MARTFVEKLQIAVTDPARAMRSLRYRGGRLVHRLTGSGADAGRAPWTAAAGERLDRRLTRQLEGDGAAAEEAAAAEAARIERAEAKMRELPLMLGPKTYNTSHPDYDAAAVRNFPGKILNASPRSSNPAFRAVSRMAHGDRVPEEAWNRVLGDALAEASAVPGAEQFFERRRFVEEYLAGLRRTYKAHYQPGWVNLDDGLFLYWLVRQVKPRTIVQCGVCNGLSAGFMMLALARNGPEGRLHVIDLPPVFDPNDPAWTVEGEIYGVCIPEGKTSGWMVPDMYRDRFEVQNGDAKELLPKMVDTLDGIDVFYHDSDHTYDHMMFEFAQAKRKLTAGGLIVGDDVSWNASVWDFADQYGVPSYNFNGTVGVAFF